MFKTKVSKHTQQSDNPAGSETPVLMDTLDHFDPGPVEDMDVDVSFDILKSTSRSSSVDSCLGDIEELKETLGGAPLGKAFGHIIKELARLKVKGREQSRPIDTDPICRLLKEHLTFNEAQDQQQRSLAERMQKLEACTARFTEQGHFERLYRNPLYCTQVAPPSSFFERTKALTIIESIQLEKLFPKGAQKFSGTKAGPPIVEFLAKITEAQVLAKLPEDEFQVRLMNSCTGEPYLECKSMIEAGMSTAKMYFQLEKRYDDTESPLSAIQKLNSFKITRDMNSKLAESYILKLANIASRSQPKGVIRGLQTDLLCIRTYLDSLPARASDFVRERCNDLTVDLGRAPQFGELGTILDPHRYFLDSQIAMYGVQSNKKAMQKGAPDLFKAYPGPAYQVNGDIYGSAQGNGRSAGGQRRRPRRAQVNQISVGTQTEQEERRPRDGGSSKSYSKQSSRNQQPSKGPKPSNDRKGGTGGNYKTRADKFCTLCGYTNHTAADGCRQMLDEDGNVVKDVTPTWGACTKTARCQELCLRHPERYCPEARKQQKKSKGK